MAAKRYIQAILSAEEYSNVRITAFKLGKPMNEFVREAVLEKVKTLQPQQETDHGQEAGR